MEDIHYLTTLSLWRGEGTALLEQRVKDAIIHMQLLEQLSSQVDQKHAKYYPYHHRKGHTF